jgi:hypothetical protein
MTNERITNNENNITNKNHDSKWWCCDSHMDIIMLPYGKKGSNVYDRDLQLSVQSVPITTNVVS